MKFYVSIFLTALFIAGQSPSTAQCSEIQANTDDLQNALKVVMKHKKSWRQECLQTGPETPPLYIGLFSSRPTGACAIVAWHSPTGAEETHVLVTRQMRMVNGEKKEVFEPPAGFYNGPYDETHFPHDLVERAERHLDMTKQYANRAAVYRDLKDADEKNNVTPPAYIKDNSLLETAFREIREESGVDLTQYNDNLTITDLPPLDTQVAYVRVPFIHLTSDTRPETNTLPTEEVIWAGWVRLSAFSEDQGWLCTKIGEKTYRLKPSDWVNDRFKQAIETLRSKQNSQINESVER